jgi:hypothetical protein
MGVSTIRPWVEALYPSGLRGVLVQGEVGSGSVVVERGGAPASSPRSDPDSSPALSDQCLPDRWAGTRRPTRTCSGSFPWGNEPSAADFPDLIA